MLHCVESSGGVFGRHQGTKMRIRAFFGPTMECNSTQFKNLYQSVFPDVQHLVTGARADEPARCGGCIQCQWWDLTSLSQH